MRHLLRSLHRLLPTDAEPPTTTSKRLGDPAAWNWDRAFDHWSEDAWTPTPEAASSPGLLLDVVETDHAVRVRAETSGLDPADLRVRLVGRRLTFALPSRDADRDRRTWERTIELPCGVLSDHVEVRRWSGALTVRVPKTPTMRSDGVELRAG